MIKKTFNIKGMHCAGCVRTIERVLEKTAGVRSVSVNFASESALVEFDEHGVSESELAQAVGSVGYTLDISSREKKKGVASNEETETVSIKVLGMDSPHCAMVVENALKKLSGIKNTDIDFANQRARAVFNPKKLAVSEIFQVITDAGYTPIEEEGEAEEMLDKEKFERVKQVKNLKRKLVVGGALAVFVFLGSFPEWFPFVPKLLQNNWMLLLFTTPVQFWVGWQFYSGLKLLVKYRTADMNTLIAIGTLAAYLYSAAIVFLKIGNWGSGISATPAVYFDTSAIIIVLILLGKYLEILMKGRASEAIKKLMGLQPKTAKILKNGKEIEIPISTVGVGDLVIVRPGERVPVDGKIIEGESEIDESMITGESMPIHKTAGSLVIGSTINTFGAFTFCATKVGKDTLLSKIIKMVEEAQGSKAPIQRLADVVSSYFVPVVIGVATFTFIGWFLFGSAFIPKEIGETAFRFALINFVAVLIIACPCALGLATPIAIMVSSGNAASRGILVKDAASLEIASKLDTIILDKTGTLTQGKPQLTDVIAFHNKKQAEVLRVAASLEQRSEHPLAKAILQYAASVDQKSSHPLDRAITEEAKREKISLYALENFKAISGKGLRGSLVVGSQKIEAYLGNRALIQELDLDIAPYEDTIAGLESKGKTVMVLVTDKVIGGVLAVADVLKDESKKAVETLQNSNLDVWMITGDNKRTALAIGRTVGIPESNILAEILPDKKSEKVRELQAVGKNVAMVGDGINDAPALTQADVGIAMSEGTDIAMESANITLMRGDLMLIPEIIKLSRQTMSIIKQNLFWAFFYNSAFIPVAAGALYPFFGILLNPIFAAAAMAFSSISVVLNSLRLKS